MTHTDKSAYKKLIDEDVSALNKYMPTHSLEKKHIIEVLTSSVETLYPEQPSSDERVLCAAIWYKNGKKYPHMPKNVDSGIMVSGNGHSICNTLLKTMFPNREYITDNHDGKTTIQGFITSHRRFVDRTEAAEIAFKIGQIPNPIKILYSEDLY